MNEDLRKHFEEIQHQSALLNDYVKIFQETHNLSDSRIAIVLLNLATFLNSKLIGELEDDSRK